MKINEAGKEHAETIATLIMAAMTDECCLYFAGEKHTIDDFHRMMTELVEMEDSQYSYRNTLLATSEDGRVMGASVSYDGAKLHENT